MAERQPLVPGVAQHLRYGGKLIGICGGYQMLGDSIADPDGIEGQPGTSEGLGFLQMKTVLRPQKQLHRIAARLTLGDTPVNGYEIHAGVTEDKPCKVRPSCWRDDRMAQSPKMARSWVVTCMACLRTALPAWPY